MRAGMRRVVPLLALVLACQPDPPPTTTPADTTAPSDGADGGGPPPTKTDDVTDTYHGTEVADPYRWLENAGDPEVAAWSDAQNAYARSVLDALPAAATLRPQVEAVLAKPVVSYSGLTRANGRMFASKRQPPKQQPLVVTFELGDPGGTERVLLDPMVLDRSGGTSVDWFIPSPDGSLLAVSMSKGGTESGDVHVFDVATGKQVHEVIPRVNGGTAGGDLGWAPDGKGFYYTRYPRKGERPDEDLDFYLQLYFHRLGTPEAEDVYLLGKDLPRVAEIQLDVHPRKGRVLATVQKGDGGEFAHFLGTPAGGSGSPASKWTQFSDFGDKTVHAAFGPKNELFVVSRTDAPRGRLLLTSSTKPNLAKAKEIVPEGDDTLITDFWGGGTVLATRSRIYVQYQTGGPSEIRAFDYRGKPAAGPSIAPVSAVHQMVALEGDDILFDTTSFVSPRTWSRWRAKDAQTDRLPLSSEPAADFQGVTVRREMAKSKDGTQVPVNLLLPPGAKSDKSAPCLVTGYGGYAVNIVPYVRKSWSVLLQHGFVVAVVNLRGGAEYGEAWHEAGRLTRKQNVFDDFAGAVQHMVDAGHCAPDRVAIEGGSNGGLLMGATLVQHPDLASAVVAHVGIYDMLRVELSPNGAFNITEFGTVKDPDHFAALRAYSPYHNVTDGTAYPAVLFMTGANDPRVDPMQSRKMTGRLQAATSSEAPVLLRTSSNTGHGGGTPLSARVEQTVDAYAFLFDQLGVTAK